MRTLWCVAILAATAYGQDRPVGQGVNFYSREKELALGQSLAAEVRRHTTPLDNAAVKDYVTRVVANLAAHLPNGYTYQFDLIEDDMVGETHEPAAYPGGYLFVSHYLFTAAQNEAEFAGMLAHAMAHVAARHQTRQMTKGELAQVGALAALSAQSQTSGTFGAPPVPMGQISLQRANEREADSIAVQAMAAAGYDPAGLAAYVMRVQPGPGKGSVARVFDIMPERDERVSAINKEIGQLPARTYQAGDDFARVKALIAVPVKLVNAPTLYRK